MCSFLVKVPFGAKLARVFVDKKEYSVCYTGSVLEASFGILLKYVYIALGAYCPVAIIIIIKIVVVRCPSVCQYQKVTGNDVTSRHQWLYTWPWSVRN